MKAAAAAIAALDSATVGSLLSAGFVEIDLDGVATRIDAQELEILSEEVGGWLVAQEGSITVALDSQLTPELLEQGYARELVRCVQSLRKKADLALTDRIRVGYAVSPAVEAAIAKHREYICGEVLAVSLLAEGVPAGEASEGFEIAGAAAQLAISRA